MNLKSIKKVSLAFFPAFFLVISIVILSRLSIFSLKKITCQLDQYPCPLNFEPVLVNFYQRNIFTLKKQQVVSTLTAFDADLAEVEVVKKLPNQLLITLKRRQPIAQLVPFLNLDFIGRDSTASATISGEMTNQFFQLDKSGEIFMAGHQPTSLFPLVAVPEDFNFELKVSPATQQISQVIQSLQEHYVSFHLLAWLNQSLAVIKTSLGSYAIINPSQSIKPQIASLQFILSGIKIGESLPKKIDLRFDKPVLTF